MKIAVVGSLEGNLKAMYEEICRKELVEQVKIDLVLICGNFEAVRNQNDRKCVDQYECWIKSDFQEYFSGKRKASHLTLVIGGSQEASNYFKTLPYGGWIAPKIFFMGHSNVVQFNGLRIGGVSGIHDKFFDHFYKTEITKTGYFERLPLDARDRRSICYTRYLEIYRMMQLQESLDLMFTFDWPVDVLGDKQSTIEMLKKVPFIFQNGALFNDLGSELYKTLLDHLMPRMWFAGKVRHGLNKVYRPPSGGGRETHFYSLDKYLPKKKRLVVIDVDAPNENGLEYDLEWLAILKATNQFVSVGQEPNYELPELKTPIKASLDEEKALVRGALSSFRIPRNFSIDLPMKSVAKITFKDVDPKRERNYVSKQTKSFCSLLALSDPNQMILDSIGTKKRGVKSRCIKDASRLASSMRLLCAKFRTAKKMKN